MGVRHSKDAIPVHRGKIDLALVAQIADPAATTGKDKKVQLSRSGAARVVLLYASIILLGLCPALALAEDIEVVAEPEGTEEVAVVVQDDVQYEIDDADESEVSVRVQANESPYGLYIGSKSDGTAVTAENKNDIPVDASVGTKTGKASYDPKTNTLKLNNYHLQSTQTNGILYMGNGATLTIELSGSNSISGKTWGILANPASVVIKGSGSLTLNESGTTAKRGIEASQELTINSGTVKAFATTVGIEGDVNVTINGGTVTTSCSGEYGCGINASEGNAVINGGTVTTSGGEQGAGINSIYGNVVIKGGTLTTSGGRSCIFTTYGSVTLGSGVSVKAGASEASAKDVKPTVFQTKYETYNWARLSSGTPVKSVTVSPTTATLYVGKTKALKATVKPSDAADKTVSWKSSKTSVAKVNKSGKVTAVAPGKATITATAGGKSGKCVVTVKGVPAKPSKPSTQSHPSAGTMDASWKAVKDAESYELSWRVADGKWQTKKVKATKATIEGLTAGNLYDVRVRAVNGAGKGEWSAQVHRFLKSVSNVKAAPGNAKGSIEVTWKKDKSANAGYKVFVYTSKEGEAVATKTVSKSKVSATIEGLESGKEYYVRVRPLRTESGTTYVGALSGYHIAKAK